jgi:carbon monoxide dehydrogenase subunit G
MTLFARVLLFLFLLAPLCQPAAGDPGQYVSDDDVAVVRAGDHFSVDMIAHAPVPLEGAWDVLVDFEHMADFMPNLRSSEVLERNGTVIRVRQTGVARYGMFSTRFDFVREFALKPRREIRAHSQGGNVRRMDSVMKLEPEEGAVRLLYHAELEPDFWMPPVIGPGFIRHETAEQFSAMIREMVRRR